MYIRISKLFSYSFLVYFLFINLTVNSLIAAKPLQAKPILRKTFEVNRTIKTLKYTILMMERMGNDNIQKKTDFKINFDPYKIYLKQYYPNHGLEILYNPEVTDGKALLNRNALVFSTLKLDPLGNMMRKESHHSIFKAGFSYLLEVIEFLCDTYPEATTSAWKYEGIVKYNNVICHKIVFDHPDFRFIDYTMKEGENLENLSRKLKLCDYTIFENNPQFRSFDDFKAGDKIKIPTGYGKQIIIYIDKEKYIPIGLKVYDDKGLFEHYTYTNIVINPEFSPDEFTSTYPGYGFR